MRIGIVTPAPARSRYGNRVTALRWAKILRKLGHRVTVAQDYDRSPFDLLITLHARRSFPSIRRFKRLHPEKPLIVALTGTDLYRDLRRSRRAQQSLELATRIVVLQPKALESIRAQWRKKARVIYQSATLGNSSRNSTRLRRRTEVQAKVATTKHFDVLVIGHLRPVKDPFRAALAARLLPPESRVRVFQLGGAMTRAMASRARAEMQLNPRYRWLDEQPRWRVSRRLQRSQLLVLSSRLEGGANVLSETVVASVPVLASRIPGSIGILGKDYPGYFGVGKTRELARLLRRAETDAPFLNNLKQRCAKLAPLFDPQHEAAAWEQVLDEIRLADTSAAGD